MNRSLLFVSALTAAAACHSSPPTPEVAPAGRALPVGVTMAMVAAGDTIFNTRSCKNCHAVGGVGSPRGPNLTDNTWIHIDGSFGQIVNLVTTGFTKAELKDTSYPFSMNPRGGTQLTDDQIREVAAYVWSLSHK